MPAARNTEEQSNDKGVLVLATGTLVRVPAEGVAVPSHAYDPELGATVPVARFFVLTD